VLKIVLETGGMKLGRVALDGTRIKASASKHKVMSYGRMVEQEEAIRGQVKELMARAAAATDAEEDTLFKRPQGRNASPLYNPHNRVSSIRGRKYPVHDSVVAFNAAHHHEICRS
jgi:hypothetical protein